MFIDKTTIFVQAGHGGKGSMSFLRKKFVPKGGPDGGDGGRGGDVVLVASHGESSLVDLHFQTNWKAEHGVDGSGQQMTGRRGADCRIKVPMGTLVFDKETDQLVCDLREDGQECIVARGGKGGLGNLHFVTPVNRAPRICQPGLPGEERTLELELKTIADVGLVGFPNAGKSTLIGAVSNAHPKTASYPFTTLFPNVGIVETDDYRRFTLADIPGLVEGAHENCGLGEEFLRHIERCRMFCYVLDMGGVDGRSPIDDLRILREELDQYEPGMSARPYIIVANKMDLPESAENLAALKASEPAGTDIVECCAELREGTEALVSLLRSRLDALPPEDEETTRRLISRHHKGGLAEPEAFKGNALEGWE